MFYYILFFFILALIYALIVCRSVYQHCSPDPSLGRYFCGQHRQKKGLKFEYNGLKFKYKGIAQNATYIGATQMKQILNNAKTPHNTQRPPIA